MATENKEYFRNNRAKEENDDSSNTTSLITKRLLQSCLAGRCFENLDSTPIPSQDSVAQIIQSTRRIMFPGYFTQSELGPSNLEYCLHQEVKELLKLLSKQICLCIQHKVKHSDWSSSQCNELGHKKALEFMHSLPRLRTLLATDVQAGFTGDPAAKSHDEVIFSYPGLFAILVYRMAHELHRLDIPLLPRMMTEYAHSLTGIDIHPGAKISESFFIDHGTGVVVGETTEIGSRVRIYQGVTLGALSIPSDRIELYRYKKRHPSIEDDVIIYANATILGGDTIIGARSVIGGNVWITKSVPPDTKVILKQPDLLYTENNRKTSADKRNKKMTALLSKHVEVSAKEKCC
ncbi:MAG: serine acetyltransferase [Desulfobacterales bacterium]|nr:MAG: serine acetyltransferase [Desulfobacterales bacterium]